jgi:hypothetical protein
MEEKKEGRKIRKPTTTTLGSSIRFKFIRGFH